MLGVLFTIGLLAIWFGHLLNERKKLELLTLQSEAVVITPVFDRGIMKTEVQLLEEDNDIDDEESPTFEDYAFLTVNELRRFYKQMVVSAMVLGNRGTIEDTNVNVNNENDAEKKHWGSIQDFIMENWGRARWRLKLG